MSRDWRDERIDELEGRYDDEHLHSALAGLTPAQVHFGRAADVLQQREQVLRAA